MNRAILFLASMLLALVMSGPVLAAESPSDDAARRLYDRVMQEFQRKDFEAALAGFRFFLELHQKAPLAASAQYWAGECELRLGRPREALQSFNAVLMSYPINPKKAAATLKAGLAYAKLGQRTESRLMLERVIIQFPRSPEAELARKAIQTQS
jgi:tol-pal system protein YbgF